MKDNKEDDTVRYKNTLESYENSLGNNYISEENNAKINMKEENKNIIDKLYDCGDELSLEDDNLNNYYLNEINKEINKDENSNKKERYNINMNMFKFIDNDEYMDIKNNNYSNKKINKNNQNEKENQKIYFDGGVDKKNSNEKENKNDNDEMDRQNSSDYIKNGVEEKNLEKINDNEDININNNINNKENKFYNIFNKKKIGKNNHIDLNKYKLDVDNMIDINNKDYFTGETEEKIKENNNNYSIDEREKTEEKIDKNDNKNSPTNFKYEDIKKEIFNESIYKYENSNEKNKSIKEENINNNNKMINNDKDKDEFNGQNNNEKNLENEKKEEDNIQNIILMDKIKNKNKIQKEHHNKSMEYLNYNIFDELQIKNDVINIKKKKKIISSQVDYISKNSEEKEDLNNSGIENDFTLSNFNKNKIKRMKSTEINEYKYIKDMNIDYNDKESNKKNNEDMELTYLTKLSQLKNDNSNLLSENNMHKL